MSRHRADAGPRAETGTPAVLARDVQTAHGTYSAGLPVLVLLRQGRRAIVCLDNGAHPRGGLCHTVTIHTSNLGEQ